MAYNILLSKRNIYSQNGEDGVIEYIFNHVAVQDPGVCCEFGAWDGVHLSNTRNLILQRGWTGVMIEGEKERIASIKDNYKNRQDVFAISEFVDDDKNSLRNILIRYKLEKYIDKMDFLSIDIDGLDSYIFGSLDIKPKVICIEVNAGHDPAASASLNVPSRVIILANPGKDSRTPQPSRDIN